MARFAVCPYYGCNEDICDVGCGYITAHDASQISRYCSAEYQACPKFTELVDRFGTDIKRLPEVRIPTSITPPAAVTGEAGIATGLAAAGSAVLLYTLHKTGLMGSDVHLTGGLVFLAVAIQIVVGMLAMKKKTFRGMMFIGGGLLWSSILALDILPAGGFGTAPSPLALSGFLAFWGLFGLLPLQTEVKVTPVCRAFFAGTSLFLFLLAGTPYIAVLQPVALAVGATAGLLGMAAGLHYALQGVRTIGEVATARARRPR
jgi:hypothetical protein